MIHLHWTESLVSILNIRDVHCMFIFRFATKKRIFVRLERIQGEKENTVFTKVCTQTSHCSYQHGDQDMDFHKYILA